MRFYSHNAAIADELQELRADLLTLLAKRTGHIEFMGSLVKFLELTKAFCVEQQTPEWGKGATQMISELKGLGMKALGE